MKTKYDYILEIRNIYTDWTLGDKLNIDQKNNKVEKLLDDYAKLANEANQGTEPALHIQNIVYCPLCHHTRITRREDDTFSCHKCGNLFIG